MDFTANAGLLHVAQLLYQLEVMLLHSSLSGAEVSHRPCLASCSNCHCNPYLPRKQSTDLTSLVLQLWTSWLCTHTGINSCGRPGVATVVTGPQWWKISVAIRLCDSMGLGV